MIANSDHGLLWKGRYMYDQVVHTPVIFAGLGIPTDRSVDALTESIDIAPTIAEIMGLKLPYAQGQSLRPLFSGGGVRHKTAVHSEFPELKMVRTENYKLVHYSNQRYGELYDLSRDPDEFDNLYADAAHAETRADMYRRLGDWLLSSQDPMHAPVEDPK